MHITQTNYFVILVHNMCDIFLFVIYSFFFCIVFICSSLFYNIKIAYNHYLASYCEFFYVLVVLLDLVLKASGIDFR